MTAPLDGRTRDRSVLEEERDFFLRSLRDLDAEHAAGDIDDVDYRSLRDDYTVRAADVVRQLAALDAPPPSLSPPVDPPPAGLPSSEPSDEGSEPSVAALEAEPGTGVAARPAWRRPWFLAAAALIVAAGVAWAVVGLTRGTDTTAQRVAGLQAKAQAALDKGDAFGALAEYDAALRLDPTDPTSLTGEGIVYVLASQNSPSSQVQQAQLDALLRQGQTDLQRAEIADPSYFPAYGWRGVALYDEGRYRAAIPQFETYLADAPKKFDKERTSVTTGLAEARKRVATGAA